MTASRLPYPLTLQGETSRGDRVVLREWEPSDLARLVVMLDEPEIARWTPMPSPFDTEAGTAYLKRAHQGRVGGTRIQLAITTGGGRPVGEITLFGVDTGRHEAELGYLVALEHRGQGFASAALSLLTAYAVSNLDLSRLLLRIDPRNSGSVAVARRCGYRLTGEPPILQEGPHGPAGLDTWELVDGRAGTPRDRLKNVASRRYGRRT